ncbi:site-specific integrase [Longispora fulva]|uniref:Integrase n=1 Tax=Longispora fulva TaxID=619741 RepID=A0A8J7GVF0_9ACTN|nr:tyrosine-type recombinase/integrase [Longispora fulva]MBG6139289.1 integrase [Longispora fulva]GIG58784.1 site-specific integrase [Longispora fulva]
MATPQGTKGRTRGEIEELPSGSLRVRVYAGIDPVSRKRNYLVETVPPGPNAAKLAEKVRTRFLNQVDEQRNPKTKATIGQLMDRYMELTEIDDKTKSGYEGIIRNHIRPLLGHVQVARLDGEVVDSFYAELRRCRTHCKGRAGTDHHTEGPHSCDKRCRAHVCKPLAQATIRKVHWVLSGAYKRAIRWRWLTVNPIEMTEPPPSPPPKPHPPTTDQAARILNEAFKDLDWGMLVWMAMVTGARRGELCAIRWEYVELDKGVLTIRSSIGQEGGRTWEKDTKDHQQRRIALDADSIALLRAYLLHCETQADALGLKLPRDARVFSLDPDHATWRKPDSVSQRYSNMCARLGWDMNIHDLRHYSATELISSGVDVRTVAGRLGHGGGGTTTLRVYSAWRAEADQRAAGNLTNHIPRPPVALDVSGTPTTVREPEEPSAPYERIAADLRAAMACGVLRSGDELPTMADLGNRYSVAISTAHRAVELLQAERLVAVSRGRRARVV